MDTAYVETVRLLLAATPEVFRAPCFPLKGGTALNLFVHPLPGRMRFSREPGFHLGLTSLSPLGCLSVRVI